MSNARDTRLRAELGEYGFRRLIEHVVSSGTPERMLGAAGRRWLASKARHHGYESVVLQDLYVIAQRIAEKGNGTEQLVDLVDIALWKMGLTPEYTQPLFGAEQALRARAGEWERAIHQVDSLGNADDQLLVHGEVALLKKKKGEEVESHLSVVKRVAKNADWEVVEFVAERLASCFPEMSILLASNIPVPELRFDADFREMPNPGRCLYRVFAAIAAGDMDQARRLRPGRSVPEERLHANLGILQAIMRKGSAGLKNHVRELLGDVDTVVAGSSVKTFVTAFIIREGARLSVEQYVNMLDDLCEVVGTKAMFPWLVPAIDACLNKDLDATRAAVSCVHQRDLSDLCYWRMQVMGAETGGVAPAESTILGPDLIKADTAASMAKCHFEKTEPIVTMIKTGIGAIHAFTRMAEQVMDQDWSLAQSLLKTGFDLLGNDVEVAACYSRSEALRLLVRRDGPFRNDAVAMAISGVQSASPVVLRHEISLELGRCIAAAFCGWAEEELSFLAHVNECCRKSEQKTAIQEGIVCGLTQAAGVELSKILLGEYRSATGGSPHSLSCAAASLGCDAKFIAALGEHVASADRHLGALLFGKAAEAVAILDAGDGRDKAARDVLTHVLASVPELAWDVCGRCGCDALAFAEATESTLRTLFHRESSRRECWLRCCVEHALCETEIEDGKALSRTAIGRVFEATRISKDPLAIEMNCDSPLTQSVCRGIVKAFRQYINGVEKNGWTEYQLNGAMDYLARLDWPSFKSISHDAEIGTYALHLVQHRRLFIAILSPDADLEDMLQDIGCIRTVLRGSIKDENVVQEIRAWILACGAARAPEFAAKAIASLPPVRRTEFVKYLEHVSSLQPWSLDQIRSVAESLNECGTEGRVLDAYARLLTWLARTSSIDASIYDGLYTMAHRCEDGRTQCCIAEQLDQVSPQIAACLMVEALEHAKTESDGETIFKVLCHLKNAAKCQGVGDTNGVHNFYVCLKQKWSEAADESGTPTMKAEHAARLLAGITVDDEKQQHAAMESAVQVVEFKSTTDISLLCEGLRKNEVIKTEVKNECVKQIVLKAIQEGVCKWHEIDDLITSQDTKAEVLIDLMSRVGPDHNSALIDRTIQEVGRLEREAQSWALLRIGDNLLPHDVATSTTLYVRALEAACLHENAVALLHTAQSLVTTCMRHSALDADRLSKKIQEIASRDLFDSDRNVLFYDWDAVCLLTAGLIVWPHDHQRFQECCREAMSKSISIKDSFWEFVLERTYVSAYEVHGPERAGKLVMDLLGVFPRESQPELADRVLSLCLAYQSAGRPLACYQVWRYAPELHYVPLIHDLVGVCTESAAAVAHLSLAMCGGRNGSPVDAQELEKSWVLSQADEPESDRHFKRDLLTMYAIVHGVGGAVQGLLRLLPDPNRRNMNLPGIIAAALSSISSPDQLLQDLWSRTQRSFSV